MSRLQPPPTIKLISNPSPLSLLDVDFLSDHPPGSCTCLMIGVIGLDDDH